MCRSMFYIDGPSGQEHVVPGDKANIVDGCLIITRNRADGPSEIMLALAAGAWYSFEEKPHEETRDGNATT